MDAESNPLLDLYKEHVGPSPDVRSVYVGFALFAGGVALALVGVGVFVGSAALGADSFATREVAAVAGALGLPALLLGTTVLLPVDRRAVLTAVAGSAVCLVGVGLFASVYPGRWNVGGPRDVTGPVVALYALGVVAVVGATGAALVGYRIERVEQTVPAGEGETAGASDGPDPEATGERARADYEDAIADADVNWGGVASPDTKRLELDTSAADEVDSASFDTAEANETRSSGRDVDDAVSGLRGLQGEGTESESGDGTDDQTAALQELKRQQREEGGRGDDGVVDRVRRLISRS